MIVLSGFCTLICLTVNCLQISVSGQGFIWQFCGRGPELFWPRVVSALACFGLDHFALPWVIPTNFSGSFRPDFFGPFRLGKIDLLNNNLVV